MSAAVDALVPARAAFRPVVDLGTGAVVAVEAHAVPLDPLPADPVARDVRAAVDAAHAAADLGTRLPVQIGVRAETLAQGDPVLAELHQGLTATGRRPHEVILSAGGGFPPALRLPVTAALHGLRRAGYLVALDGVGAVHAPLDLLVDVVPYLVRLDGELARRAGSDPRRAALVTAVAELAGRIGAHLLAPGLTAEEHVLRARDLGVRLVQGTALAPPEWRPGMPVTVPVAAREAPRGPRPETTLGPRVSEFTLPAVTMPDDATAEEVLAVLTAEEGVSGVVLVDERRRPVATVDRSRFLLRLSGAYGHALHAHKPAARLADPPRTVPHTVPAIAALRAAGSSAGGATGGEGDRVYDDLVVTDEVGRCAGIVRVADLIRGLTR
ncbi:EAL domain-containing protein [Actinomadura kijaniata]|uniref:EAL domain-containing protein n=1 Tax=Actinomadura kijaniata TaxID=46161 RepID=UPI001FE1054D|nr:EAL domain-containing protein [Actinomadura kijaniata]